MVSTVILMFGRFQPPTIGHQRLIQSALALGTQEDADVALFISNTTDTKENPLTHEEKSKLIRAAFSELQIGPSEIITPYRALFWAREQGYTRVILLSGGERGIAFERMVDRWKNLEDPEDTMTITVKNLPRTGEMSAKKVSGTVMRQLAQQNKYEEFKKLFLTRVPEAMVRDIFQKIQQRLGPVTEQTMFTSFADYHYHLAEAEDGFMLREVDVVPSAEPAVANTAPDEQPISADDLPSKIEQEKFKSTKQGRTPSDRPENQAKLIIHPQPRIKMEIVKKFQDMKK